MKAMNFQILICLLVVPCAWVNAGPPTSANNREGPREPPVPGPVRIPLLLVDKLILFEIATQHPYFVCVRGCAELYLRIYRETQNHQMASKAEDDCRSGCLLRHGSPPEGLPKTSQKQVARDFDEVYNEIREVVDEILGARGTEL